VRLADRSPDLLGGALLKNLQSQNARFTAANGEVQVAAVTPGGGPIQFSLKNVPTDGPDLLVKLTVRAEASEALDREIARRLWVSVNTIPPERFQLWVNAKDFTSRVFFRNAADGPVDLSFEMEGGDPITISGLTVHAHADAMYREYERGLVLVNPSLHPYAFDLAEHLPGQSFRRLKGSPQQSPDTNDGSAVNAAVELAAKDGLFLVREP
jgi:hypothetical protein